MKKIVINGILAIFSTLIILTVLSDMAHASGIPLCDSKPTVREQATCTELVLKGGHLRLQKNYDRIIASKLIPQSKKDGLPGTHMRWADKMNKACSSDDVGCRYEWLSARNNVIIRFMNHYGVDPI